MFLDIRRVLSIGNSWNWDICVEVLCSIAICDQRAFIIFIPICWNDLFVSLYEDEFHQIYSHKPINIELQLYIRCKNF